MELTGNYNLEIEIAGNQVPIVPHMIEELTICQDIDRLVPTFTFRVKDVTKILNLIVPYDKESNDIRITFSRANRYDERNIFNVSAKKRRVLSDNSYEITGVLTTEGLFSPYRNRALPGILRDNLIDIVDEIPEIVNYEIGKSLNVNKTVLQPYWTNAKLLRYLKQRIKGTGGELCYYVFIKNTEGMPTLVFKSINELFVSPIKYKFIVGAEPFEDYYPISEYRIFDYSQFRTFFSAQTSIYHYFDYDTGTYQCSNELDIANYPSLTEFHLVNKDDETETCGTFLGRKNDFSGDFQGRVGQTFYDSITKSIYMWISTWGIESIAPGDITQVLFAEAMNRGNLFVYQPSGFWMVKRVVHVLGSTFMTNLLLVRNGVDTDMNTTLLEAEEVRKQ